MKRVGLFPGLHKRHTVRKARWPLQWTTQAQRSMRGGEEEAPATRPVGVLDPANLLEFSHLATLDAS